MSISRRVWENRDQALSAARVVAVFGRACTLVSAGELVTSLVLEEIGSGPLNIVLRGDPGIFNRVEPGQQVSYSGDSLVVGGLRIALDETDLWEPRPDWDSLRQHDDLSASLSALREESVQSAPGLGLLSLLSDGPVSRPTESALPAAFGATARQGAQELIAGWDEASESLRRGAELLAGLGVGLTPAGDDFLLGVMLWAWLAHPSPRHVCQILMEEAAPRTTVLSAATLRAAAVGECSAPWHGLLRALASSDGHGIAAAVQTILSIGSTSGADSLAGFLWMEHGVQSP